MTKFIQQVIQQIYTEGYYVPDTLQGYEDTEMSKMTYSFSSVGVSIVIKINK